QRSLSERAPGFGGNSVLPVGGNHLAVLQRRMQFHLVHGRNDSSLGDQLVQVIRLEVRHANGTDLVLCVQLFQGLPRLNVEVLFGSWPMDQEQVEVVQAQAPQTCVKGFKCLFVPHVGDPDLGGDKQFFASNARLGQSLADALFVAVNRGG